jgi:ribosomal protein S12 methylthiotransferase accessory factor
MSCYIKERAAEIETAIKLWSQVLDDFQLKCVKKDYTVNQFTSRLCYLITDDLTARGIGKGSNSVEIDISASFEALEYYLSGYCFHQYPILFGSLLEISKNYSLILNRCHLEKMMNDSNVKLSLPWVVYEDILSKKQHATPLAAVDLFYQANLLENDTFDYANSSFYAASNGLAIGATYEESVIHGALEIIERDAYSYFLIDTYLLNKSPLVLNIKTLPTDIISLIDHIEKNYLNKMIILKMPSRFGVHAYLATFLNKTFEIQPRGTGASLNAKYALERAIFELIQTYNLMHGSYIESKINMQRLNNNILIKNFLELNLSRFYQNSAHINFDCSSNEIQFITLSTYLEKLVELIFTQSSLLVNVVYQNLNGLTCTRVIIPEAEEFFLATHYVKLTPKSYMQSYITNESGKEFIWDHFE